MESQDKIHVLFITRKFPPFSGGMERMAYHLYMGLHEICNVSLVKWTKRNAMFVFGYIYLFLRAVHKILTDKVDVIYLQDGLLAPVGVGLKVVFGKPVVATVHGLDITYPNAIYQAFMPTLVSLLDRIITVSDAGRQECIKRSINPSRIHVIPNGVHIPREVLHSVKRSEDDVFNSRRRLEHLTGAPEDSPIILMVGRMIERKGFHWFIEKVFPEIVEHFPNAICLHIGEGEFRDEIENVISCNEASTNVKLLGRLRDVDLYHAYLGADLFVMPNIHVEGDLEGFGLVAVEAAYFGLPVIASDVDGVPTAIVHNRNGIVCKEKDVDCFVTHICELIGDSTYRESFGEQAQEFTRRYRDWQSIAKRYVNAFSSVLSQ